MKRLIFFLVSCLLFCSVSYANQMDTSPSWEMCKVFDLSKLDNLPVAHVSPASRGMDTSLTFDRIDHGASASQAVTVSPERLHYRLIEPCGDDKRLS
jgi:hypothetical protein